MSTDLNAVFAHAFTEALRPLYKRLDEVETLVRSLAAILDEHEEMHGVDLAAKSSTPIADAICMAVPPSDDLFPNQQWTPCDLPPGHDGPHNCGLVT